MDSYSLRYLNENEDDKIRVVRVVNLDFGRGSNFGDLNIVATPPRPASQTIATMRLFIAGCS